MLLSTQNVCWLLDDHAGIFDNLFNFWEDILKQLLRKMLVGAISYEQFMIVWIVLKFDWWFSEYFSYSYYLLGRIH